MLIKGWWTSWSIRFVCPCLFYVCIGKVFFCRQYWSLLQHVSTNSRFQYLCEILAQEVVVFWLSIFFVCVICCGCSTGLLQLGIIRWLAHLRPRCRTVVWCEWKLRVHWDYHLWVQATCFWKCCVVVPCRYDWLLPILLLLYVTFGFLGGCYWIFSVSFLLFLCLSLPDFFLL